MFKFNTTVRQKVLNIIFRKSVVVHAGQIGATLSSSSHPVQKAPAELSDC